MQKLALVWLFLAANGLLASTRRLAKPWPTESCKRPQAAEANSISLTAFVNLIAALEPLSAFNLAGHGALFPTHNSRKRMWLRMCAGTPSPPVARRDPQKVAFGKIAGENRGLNPMDPAIEMVDDYFWLRDDSYKAEVLGLLREENAYTVSATDHLTKFSDELYRELKSYVEFKKGDFEKIILAGFAAIAALGFVSFGAYTALQSDIDPAVVGGAAVAVAAVAAASIPTIAGSSAAQDAALDELTSFPSPDYDGNEYWSRRGDDTLKSLQYVRRPSGSSAEGKVILDLAKVCKSDFFVRNRGWRQETCSIGQLKPSPSGNMIAYSIDGSGSENFIIRFKNLESDSELIEQIQDTTGFLAWAGEKTLFYVKADKFGQGSTVWRHELGTLQAKDELVYEEPDESFNVGIQGTRDGSLIIIGSFSDIEMASEERFIPTATPNAPPTLIRPRELGVDYVVDSHAPSRSLYLLSNLGDAPFGLFVASLDSPSTWTPVFDKNSKFSFESAQVEAVTCFSNFLALRGREAGFTQLWLIPLSADKLGAAGDVVRVELGAEPATVNLADGNIFYSDSKLRVDYTSLTTPSTLLEYDFNSREIKTLRENPVNNFDKSLYKTAETQVIARDGAEVPVTLLWRPDKVGSAMEKGGGGAPCHLFGYGAYGTCVDPSFEAFLLPFVNRGIVYAIAHVRGGGEKGGINWYEASGKYLTKQNTFNDFVDVAQGLIDQGIAKPGSITCEGRSAGGLLVGNVANMAPDLFKAVFAEAPLVDVMSVADPSLPISCQLWAELGNPNEVEYHDYMKSYSPIDNVRDGVTYPSILITAGLNDPRVQVWQASKWVQVLRSRIANGKDVLLKTNLGGHYEATSTGKGRDLYMRDLAFQYAWLLDKIGKAE